MNYKRTQQMMTKQDVYPEKESDSGCTDKVRSLLRVQEDSRQAHEDEKKSKT